ncbi:MAG TPA: NAD-glutamate dehydrogenase [Alphaproteobacteria bacterium]
MATRDQARKNEIIDELAGVARARLKGDAAAQAEAFLRQFYANLATDDLTERFIDDLYGAGMALWEFAKMRQPGTAKVRVYTPKRAEHGWESRHTVVEIVNDDMPFLVDSITAEINRRDLAVHLVIHPVVSVQRDKGALKGLAERGAKGAIAESMMHVELDEITASDAVAALQQGVESVLQAVRASVDDWKPVCTRAKEVIEQLEKNPPKKIPADEVRTAREFLSWMLDNHFTFLGYREYEFAGDGAASRAGIVSGRGLGLCRDDSYVIFDGLRNLSTLPLEVQEFVRQPRLMKIAKANRRSNVHRSAYLDTIGIKKFNAKGDVVGEHIFLGLFTSTAYSERPSDIPLLAEKIGRIVKRSGFAPNSHDGKALQHILETYPRDELFQASEDELFDTSLGILGLQERHRIALFVRRDPYERFISALVFIPRDRFNTDLRIKFHQILAKAYEGRTSAFYVHFADDSVLVRVLFIVGTTPGRVPQVSVEEVERRLVEAGRSFADHLREALVGTFGEEHGLAKLREYGAAFPSGYRDRFSPDIAVSDVTLIDEVVEETIPIGLNLYRTVEAAGNELGLRVVNKDRPVPLSDVLPMLESMGLRVMTEAPYEIRKAAIDGSPAAVVWLHDLSMICRDAKEVDLATIKPAFEETFAAVWTGTAESDGFNRLVIGAGLRVREVAVLRAYAKYLRQAGIPFSQAYMEDTLAAYPKIARRLVDLFLTVHNPAARKDADVRANGIVVEINHLLDEVQNLDEDRILRRFLNLVRVTQRTNYFQKADDGTTKPYISFKLDSQKIDDLPLPRPLVEIWVYSPDVEAVHLRGGRVARGGIRWSDRREDFRTEILGLIKAQMVKNAVIVPVGSKGGFFVKRPPPAEAGRDAWLAKGIDCYKTFMRGMLDITDNITPKGIVPPRDVVRLDTDDPYLVVAADKGTATFSDIANSVARDYGFWLDDAFASGGSAGYDHKVMAITARGAWEAVKRHFRELGLDTQTTDFTVVGVGDMSGDVFGNGMLRSQHIRLLAAFDHRHIFVDPNPDPAAAFAERERLFKLPRSSWADYDAKLISKGGGVFDRKAKSLKLTPEIKKALDISADSVTPADLMKTALKAPIDLLFFGGIGNYVKAAAESHAECGDRANDAVRVNGRDIRARVVGEGANLGVTQRGRIEYAQTGAGGKGGRINTDAIDNSAGVDTSDHEVNIKILLGDVVTRGAMTLKQRDALLASMTDEVAELVLRDNYLQTEALSLAELEGPSGLDRFARLIRSQEKSGRLNRAIEFLPDDEEIAARQTARRALTRPELSVLLAYAKMALYDELLASDLPDDPYLADDLMRYFPRPLRKDYAEAIGRHRLRREIIATVVTNSMVNRAGISFANDLRERTGASSAEITRAYTVARQVFGLRRLWNGIEALDNKVPAATQYRMLASTTQMVERGTLWFLRYGAESIDIVATIARFEAGVAELLAAMPQTLDATRAAETALIQAALVQDGVPTALATTMSALGEMTAALDIVRIAEVVKRPVRDVAKLYFGLGARLGLDWLRTAASRIKIETPWQKRAIEAVFDDLFAQQGEIARRAVNGAVTTEKSAANGAMTSWLEHNQANVARIDALLVELRASPAIDLAALTVAGRELRALTGG